MPLAEDQRALLQLLLEGGQSYADIGSLLGISADEARTRARGALTEMGGADPDAQVGLTDYLLGQADPIGRADAARHLQSDPGTNALATKLSTQLRLLAPGARLPDLPGATAAAPPAAAAPAPAAPPTSTSQPIPPPAAGTPGGPSAPGGVTTPSAGARAAGGARSALGSVGGAFSGLGAKDKRLPVALAAAALLILAVVLVVTGVIGGGDDSSSDSADSGGAAEDVTVVELASPDGGSAGGQAAFSSAGEQPVAQLNLFGLEPSADQFIYVVWFYNSDAEAVPFGFQAADESGNITGATPVPAGVISALPTIQQIRVSKLTEADAKKLSKATQQGTKNNRPPPYVGETVLEGAIPRSADAVVPTDATGATGTTPAPTTPTPTTPAPTGTTPSG